MKSYRVYRGWDKDQQAYYFGMELVKSPAYTYLLSNWLLDLAVYICESIPRTSWLAKWIPWWDECDNQWTTIDAYYGGFKYLWCSEFGCNGPLVRWAENYHDSKSAAAHIRLTLEQVAVLAETDPGLKELLDNLQEDTKEMLED